MMISLPSLRAGGLCKLFELARQADAIRDPADIAATTAAHHGCHWLIQLEFNRIESTWLPDTAGMCHRGILHRIINHSRRI